MSVYEQVGQTKRKKTNKESKKKMIMSVCSLAGRDNKRKKSNLNIK
jgi:hypothetical protein